MTDPILPLSGASFGANPSFLDLLRDARPDALTQLQQNVSAEATRGVPHGTTVLGLIYADGVMVAGDRRATSGYTIADDTMRKVFPADDYSAIAIAGAAGMAVEMVRLFQLELEHYEKLTGDRLSLEGKANRLAQLIRQNFPLAMQGLVVVPLFGGFDQRREDCLEHGQCGRCSFAGVHPRGDSIEQGSGPLRGVVALLDGGELFDDLAGVRPVGIGVRLERSDHPVDGRRDRGSHRRGRCR